MNLRIEVEELILFARLPRSPRDDQKTWGENGVVAIESPWVYVIAETAQS
jgi:hypothetical protein